MPAFPRPHEHMNMTFSGDTKGKGEPVYTIRPCTRCLPRLYEFLEDPSPQLEVIRKYYAFLSAFDLDNPCTLRGDDGCFYSDQQTAPLSLGVPKSDFLTFLIQHQADREGQLEHFGCKQSSGRWPIRVNRQLA